MYKFFQNLGRSLMLPVAILPAAAIIAGIGNTLNALMWRRKSQCSYYGRYYDFRAIRHFLFAIGVAIGMAKENDCAVALAAALGYFLVTVVLSPMKLAPLLGMKASEINSVSLKR